MSFVAVVDVVVIDFTMSHLTSPRGRTRATREAYVFFIFTYSSTLKSGLERVRRTAHTVRRMGVRAVAAQWLLKDGCECCARRW